MSRHASLTFVLTPSVNVSRRELSPTSRRAASTRACQFFIAQPDIRFEGAGKQERVLEDDTELAPKVVHGVPANVHAIEQDFASLNS